MRDPRLAAGMGKAGASLGALRVLLGGVVQAGPDAALQRVLELFSGFCRGRAQCPPICFPCGKRGEGGDGAEALKGGRLNRRGGSDPLFGLRESKAQGADQRAVTHLQPFLSAGSGWVSCSCEPDEGWI